MDMKKQYDKLLGDLLGVLDAVDQACVHWQEVEAEMSESASAESVSGVPGADISVANEQPIDAARQQRASSLSPFQRVAKVVLRNLEVLVGLDHDTAEHPSPSVNIETKVAAEAGLGMETSDNLAEVIASGREGAELIQRSFLETLRQHEITPIPAQGKPFNAKTMFAIGREPDNTVPPNTVVEEIVRGYQQGDKILREAQVIVSSQ